jgi:hypothetical protein
LGWEITEGCRCVFKRAARGILVVMELFKFLACGDVWRVEWEKPMRT